MSVFLIQTAVAGQETFTPFAPGVGHAMPLTASQLAGMVDNIAWDAARDVPWADGEKRKAVKVARALTYDRMTHEVLEILPGCMFTCPGP